MLSRKTIKKVSTPGVSQHGNYVINVYRKDKFLVSYRYEGWNKNDVDSELKILKNRFADYLGFSVELG